MMTVSRSEWQTIEDAKPTAERYERMGYACAIVEHRSERAGSYIKLLATPRRDPVWDAVA